MNTYDTLYGWSRQEWARAAEYFIWCGETLPSEGDVPNALGIQDWWFNHRVDNPTEPQVLGVSVLGQITPPAPVEPETRRWVNRLFYSAAAGKCFSAAGTPVK